MRVLWLQWGDYWLVDFYYDDLDNLLDVWEAMTRGGVHIVR